MKIFVEKALRALLGIADWAKLIGWVLDVANKLALITKNVYDDIAVKLVRGGVKAYDSAKNGEETRIIIADACIDLSDAFQDLAAQTKTELDDSILLLLKSSAQLIKLDNAGPDDPRLLLIQVLAAVESAFADFVKSTETEVDDYILLALSALKEALAESSNLVMNGESSVVSVARV